MPVVPEAHCRNLLVVDGDGRPVGLVSRVDALRWMDSPPDPGATLGDMVSDGSLSTIPPTLPVDRLVELMLAEDIGRVPVVDDGGILVGLIARRDLLLARTGWHNDERDRMRFAGRKTQ